MQGQLSFSGPSCANIPGSTPIKAPTGPLPHSDSLRVTCPPAPLPTAGYPGQGGQWLIHPHFTGSARHRASLWMGS